ncbi:MAG: TRAP-type C4-dicarboxylate transport system permease small subunit [Paracoccaceae bacterium]|jgi:TRAP-type C4-dicarboxylate transport system permease small subunit
MGDSENQSQHALAKKGFAVWEYAKILPSWLSAFALFALMTMTFLDVMLRSLANNPIEAATEMTRFLMAIIVFSSLPIVSWKGTHIAVDLLDPFFSRPMAHIRDIIVDLGSGIVLLWPAIRVWQLAERARDYGDVTEYLEFPQFYIGWFIAAFTFLTAAVLIVRGLTRIFAPARIPA